MTNYKDFGGTKEGGLDPELNAQLVETASMGRITRYPSPAEFHTAALDHAELYAAEIGEQLEDEAVSQEIKNELYSLLNAGEARAAGAWGSVASREDTFLDSGDVRSLELIEVTDAEPDYGYATFEASAEATYEFPVLFMEAWDAYEEGELDSLEVDDPEESIGLASRTIRLQLMIDARYDPGTARLSDFELTSADEST